MLENYELAKNHPSNWDIDNKILNEKNVIFNILLKARVNCIGSMIFSSLLIISIFVLIIGYSEVIVVKINKDLIHEIRWYEKYIIANSSDGNSLYTSFYSYLTGWCATGTSIIFFSFSLLFKILSHKSIIIVRKKYEKNEKLIASNTLIILSYFFGLISDAIILASLNQLINKVKNNELL